MSNLTHTAYAEAKKRYALAGIDTDAALKALGGIPVSMHCWQGDDVAGFEMPDVAL
ncbi:MAG: L-rhamnose isomerase, partial [Propionivibrio sp.]|nr:L-rhamnose isomerase [Propionivibrio sp.]